MDGENNGKPYEQMDDLGGLGETFTPIFGSTPIFVTVFDQHRGMANSKLTIYTDHGSSDEDVELINPEDLESDAAKGEPEARLAKIGRLWDG